MSTSIVIQNLTSNFILSIISQQQAAIYVYEKEKGTPLAA